MMTSPTLFHLQAVDEELRPLLDAPTPWEVLDHLDDFLATVTDRRRGRVHPTAVLEGVVFLADGAEIGPHALVTGPAWIGRGVVVGHGAYLRGGVVLASGAHVGHASELKHSLLLNGARAPHFNYVGDSVIGVKVNLGAGVKLANVNTFGNDIRAAGRDTGRHKLGAVIGDGVSIGCNAVLAPGTVIGPRAVIYNGAMVRGCVPADTVVKLRQPLEQVVRREVTDP